MTTLRLRDRLCPRPRILFVGINPSGLNAAYPGFADKIVWYRRLRRFAEIDSARASP